MKTNLLTTVLLASSLVLAGCAGGSPKPNAQKVQKIQYDENGFEIDGNEINEKAETSITAGDIAKAPLFIVAGAMELTKFVAIGSIATVIVAGKTASNIISNDNDD